MVEVTFLHLLMYSYNFEVLCILDYFILYSTTEENIHATYFLPNTVHLLADTDSRLKQVLQLINMIIYVLQIKYYPTQ